MALSHVKIQKEEKATFTWPNPIQNDLVPLGRALWEKLISSYSTDKLCVHNDSNRLGIAVILAVLPILHLLAAPVKAQKNEK